MPGLATLIQSAPRGLCTAAAALTLALAVTAAPAARAQSAYNNYAGPAVILDLGALDRLGPAPSVPDRRFTLHPPRVRVADQSWTGQKIVLHRPAAPHVAAGSRIVHIGAVTIDYSALPPAGSTLADAGPRIVLHMPVAQTAAAAPPSPPTAPPMLQVAALPSSNAGANPGPGNIAPAAGPAETQAPEPGAALAATPPPADLVAVPKSDSGAVRFAPGAADLGGDARAVLDTVAQKLRVQPNERIQLVAYASAPGGGTDDAIVARRTSLARAVTVRAYLIQRGVSSARIDVRALGNRAEGGGSLDRVDLMVLGS